MSNQDYNFGLGDLFFINKKYFKYIIGMTVLAFFMSIIYSLLAPPLYQSYISIYPTRNKTNLGQLSAVSGMAASLGITLPTSQSTYNIPDIINSRKLKKVITSKEWDSNLFNQSVDLIDYWKLEEVSFLGNIISVFRKKIESPSKDFFQNIAIDKLSSRISIYEHESGMITVSILMEDELVAANIVNFISNWIQNYISNEMSFKAKKNRVFIERQLEAAKMDLFISEEDLSAFQKKHSITDDNPEVILARARLMRNVEVNQQVYITLRQQLELNKIEELKEKPVLNILDNGDIPTRKSKPLTLLIVISWTIIAFFISNFAAYFYHYFLIKKRT